jgi:hypothetical protein
MELRKKRTPEELRRRKGIDSFLSDIGGGVKELGSVWKDRFLAPVRAADKVGGALLGKDTGATHEDVIEAVLGGVTLGTPGGLPKGAIGVGQTRNEALKTLGQSAARLKWVKGATFLPPRMNVGKVRKIASSIRRTPKEVLEPLTSIKYIEPSRFGNPKTVARNVRIGQKGGESKIQLAPNARPEDWWHETGHSSAYADKGKRSLKGYLSDLLETSSDIAAERAATLNTRRGTKRGFYKDMPVETHARGVSRGITNVKATKGKIEQKDFDKVFTTEAKRVLRAVRKKAPNIYKKTLKDVAKGYRQRAAQTKRVKEGKLPDTFDEWLEGVVRNPESRKPNETIGGRLKMYNKFPTVIKSSDQAARIGKKYKFKELDYIWNQAERFSKRLAKEGDYDGAMREAMKAQGAREAMQMQFTTGKVLPFKRARFDEWRKTSREGIRRALKKKMTPAEMSRAIQDAAEAKGSPRYLRRKAGTVEISKSIKNKKPYKIRLKAD